MLIFSELYKAFGLVAWGIFPNSVLAIGKLNNDNQVPEGYSLLVKAPLRQAYTGVPTGMVFNLKMDITVVRKGGKLTYNASLDYEVSSQGTQNKAIAYSKSLEGYTSISEVLEVLDLEKKITKLLAKLNLTFGATKAGSGLVNSAKVLRDLSYLLDKLDVPSGEHVTVQFFTMDDSRLVVYVMNSFASVKLLPIQTQNKGVGLEVISHLGVDECRSVSLQDTVLVQEYFRRFFNGGKP